MQDDFEAGYVELAIAGSGVPQGVNNSILELHPSAVVNRTLPQVRTMAVTITSQGSVSQVTRAGELLSGFTFHLLRWRAVHVDRLWCTRFQILVSMGSSAEQNRAPQLMHLRCLHLAHHIVQLLWLLSFVAFAHALAGSYSFDRLREPPARLLNWPSACVL